MKTDEKTANPVKTCLQSCHREKIIRTRNCRLPEKSKRNMLTKQPQFKSRLNNTFKHGKYDLQLDFGVFYKPECKK